MSLANLYSRETLQHQLQSFPTAFRVLLNEAANNGDLALADRALDVLDSAHITRLSDTGLLYHDGAREHDLRTEILLRSLIRVLDSGDFGAAGVAYVDKLLNVAPPFAATYCLVHAITAPIEAAIVDRLIACAGKPNELAHSSLRLQNHRLEMNALAAAVVANKPEVFKRLLESAQMHAPNAFPALDLDMHHAVIQHDRNSNPTVHYLPQWIVTQAHPDKAGEFFAALFASAEPTDADIDRLLLRHLQQFLGGPVVAKVTFPRPPVEPECRHKIAAELLRFRSAEAPFPENLLHYAITNACTPILAAAAATPANDLRAYLSTQPDQVQTLNLILQAPGAPQSDITECLEIAVSNGIDINVRSRQPSEKTILFEAVKQPTLDTAQALLDLGADPDIKDARGWKAASHCKDPGLRAQFETMVGALKARQAIANTIKGSLSKRKHC